MVGIFVFLFFVSWGFSYYFMIFDVNTENYELLANVEESKIMDYISVNVYEAPVKYTSPTAVTAGVLIAKSIWYHGENTSTRVYDGSVKLPCRVVGDDLYWQYNLVTGENNFTIQTAELNSTMNCTGSFSVTGANLTIPWGFEKSTMISLQKINEMTSMGYSTFKNIAGVNEDFRITISAPSGDIEYGKSIPIGPITVISNELQRTVLETNEKVNITVLVW
ncbi:MAG: hypothetical protein KAS32_25710 [Candidatus Peribacteraceae bacterium]|nr:hypothetical protein [Candidatus Peribacteraceae bacterium]